MLKRKLAKSFAMKDLGATKKILSSRIERYVKNHNMKFSQGEYIENVFDRFRL